MDLRSIRKRKLNIHNLPKCNAVVLTMNPNLITGGQIGKLPYRIMQIELIDTVVDFDKIRLLKPNDFVDTSAVWQISLVAAPLGTGKLIRRRYDNYFLHFTAEKSSG